MTDLSDVEKWMETAGKDDLDNAADALKLAFERKEHEDKVALLHVVADGYVVGHFRGDDAEGALRYLLAHAKGLCQMRIHLINVPRSDVDAHLANRWWNDKERRND